MKTRLASVLLVVAALCVIGSQAWAMSASRLWETQVMPPGTVTVRSMAVDSRSDAAGGGTVYFHFNDSKITKVTKDGVVVGTYGNKIYKSDGINVGTTLGASGPSGMAVDPLTGYLYAGTGGTYAVIDMSVATSNVTSAHWIRNQGGMSGNQISFSPDGMYLATVAGSTGSKVTVMRRNLNGTPADYTDDTFDTVNYVVTYAPSGGLVTPTGVQDCRACALDGSGHVYIADLGDTIKPINRFKLIPGTTGTTAVNKQEMAFKANHTKVWSIDTDSYGRVWSADIPTNTASPYHAIHCYQDGAEVFSYDFWAGHSTTFPSNGAMTGNVMCYDKARDRVYITAGNNPGGTSNAEYVACYQIIGADTLAASGTVSGSVHDTAGAAVNPAGLGLKPTYLDDDANKGWPINTLLIAWSPGADGTFSSIPVPPGTWTFQAKKDEPVLTQTLLPTQKTHYQIPSGLNTDLGDFVLLPKSSEYVQATLGTHNLEQGLFIANARNAGNDPTSNVSSEVGNIGGRECRVFGNSNLAQYMIINVDDAYYPPLTIAPFWLDCDIYDTGYDRMAMQGNVRHNGEDAPACAMGWQPKTNTNQWTTWKWTRSDGVFGNWFPYVPAGGTSALFGDFRLYGMNDDAGSAPLGPKHVARISVRKVPLPNDASYMTMNSVGKAKQFIYGQFHMTDPGVRYAGGFAVKLTGATLIADGFTSSGTYPNRAYGLFEDANRTSGIRVILPEGTSYPTGLDRTKKMDVIGSVISDPETQELIIIADSVVQHDDQPAVDIKPLAWSNLRGVCGGDLNYVTKANGQTYLQRIQFGVSGGVGVPTVGLMVRLCGKVTAVGDADTSGTRYAYVDDGSHPRGEGVPGGPDMKGVKLLMNTVVGDPGLNVGDTVKATGICMMGLYDPTPADFNNNDHWRYTIVDAITAEKL